MDSPIIEESKNGNGAQSWGMNRSIHRNMTDEESFHPKKLNFFHYICIGMFLGFASCTVAATIYAFAS